MTVISEDHYHFRSKDYISGKNMNYPSNGFFGQSV